uniref:Glycosyl transferase family 2 n=1 Tax=Cyanothece sp. (strain PCC 7425 / ATCC 29141) TaxID=395961 RepID=B8HRA8_CYAP4
MTAGTTLNVSIVIPAFNAADTIAETLQSLLDQTFTNWEAIVVNDGSTDDTVVVVQRFMARDLRIHLFTQENQGLSGARNSGAKLAQGDCVLFLDADDWIFPSHLERLTHRFLADPSLDVVYCGWVHALPDREYVLPELPTLSGDLFVPFCHYCVSLMSSFLVRRSLVDLVGPFDTSMHCGGEDWDFWQRIARSGARFGLVKEVLVAYRARPNSLSRNGAILLKDSLVVLTRGYGPDPRVPHPHPVYPNGLPTADLSKHKFYLLCYCAGFLIGGGKDACSLLDILADEQCPNLLPDEVANHLMGSTFLSASKPRREWYSTWLNYRHNLKDFLIALEARSGTPNLAVRSNRIFEQLLSKYSQAKDLPGQFRKIWAYFIFLRRPLRRLIHQIQILAKRSGWSFALIFPPLRSMLQRSGKRLTLPHRLAEPDLNHTEANQLRYQYLSPQSLPGAGSKVTETLPILVYPRLAIANSEQPLSSYISPEIFENQLRYLKESGYRTISLDQWGEAVIAGKSTFDRAVVITFENCSQDFLDYGWPLLKAYGFSATLYLYADEIGQLKTTDAVTGEEIQLIEWAKIRRLQAEGVGFASHGHRRRALTSIPLVDAWLDISRSHIMLQEELSTRISTFVYPEGKLNPWLQFLVGLAGYDFGLTEQFGQCSNRHSLLALPCIRMSGLDSQEKFSAKLSITDS